MSKVKAAKQVVSQKTTQAKAAATAELTPAHANNKADNVAQHAKIESPQMNTL